MDKSFYLGILIAAGAMIQDLKARKIANRYLFVCACVICCFRGLFPGVLYDCSTQQMLCISKTALLILKDLAAGSFIPALLLGWLFRFRMIGAGDIKLLMVLGMLAGPEKSLLCVWRTLLFGAVLSAGILAAYGSGRTRMLYLGHYVSSCMRTGKYEPYRAAGSWDHAANLHMTVPILMAVLSLGLS